MKMKFLTIAATCALFVACTACSDKKADSNADSSQNIEQTTASEQSDSNGASDAAGDVGQLANKALTSLTSMDPSEFTEEEYSTMIDHMDSNLDALASGNPEVAKNFTSFYSAVGSAADDDMLPESLAAKWKDVEARYKALLQ